MDTEKRIKELQEQIEFLRKQNEKLIERIPIQFYLVPNTPPVWYNPQHPQPWDPPYVPYCSYQENINGLETTSSSKLDR